MSLEDARRYLQQLHDHPALSCQPTGFQQWDQLTGGLVRGGLTLIGGRPGMGRTALALNIVSRLAKKLTGTILIVTPETERETAARLLQIGTGVEIKKLFNGSLSPADAGWLCNKLFRDTKCKIRTESWSRPSLPVIRQWCEGIADLQLLVVDNPENIHEPWYCCENPAREPMDLVVAYLRGLAMELDIPVVCTAHLDRSLEKRKDKRPKLKDLGKICVPENSVDQVVFLYRDRYYDPNGNEDAVCLIPKTVFGQPGTVRLQWHWPTASFDDLQEDKICI